MADYGAAVSQKGYDVKTCADRFLVYSSAFPILKIFSVVAITGVVPDGASADFTANAGTDYLTSAAHGLANGDQLNFLTSGTIPGGLTILEYNYPHGGHLYYVINKTANTFQVSLTLGGSAVDITSAGAGTHTWYRDTTKIISTHDLGYLAPVIISYNGSTSIGVANSYFMSDSVYLQLWIRQYDDRTEIYIFNPDNGTTTPGATVYFTIYQFLDSFDTIAANTINAGTTLGLSSQDYGFRISKPGYDVKTCTDEQCVLSSSFFTNIIHMKGAVAGTADPIVVTHGLGYIPSFLSYLKPTGKTFYTLANEFISVNTNTLDSYPNEGDVLYYVIFKSKSI